MTIGAYIDPALGGAGGGLNIYQGIQEGDPQQVVSGTYQGLGAYTAASDASVAAGGSAFTGASAIGEWLPWIGAGLAVYDWASGEITGESTAELAGTLAVMAVPAFGVIAIPAAITRYLMAQEKAHAKRFVKMVEPSLELVHKDDGGNYYLRGLDNRDQQLEPCDPTTDSSCQETYIKFNAEKNTLETVAIDRPPNPYAETTGGQGYWKQDPVSGSELEGAEWGEFNSVLWTADESDIMKTVEDYTIAWMVNMPSLQAQIYNQVLLPEGLAPLPQATPINLNGKEYYQDSEGVVFRSNGQIVGNYNEETGGVESFVSSCTGLGCRLHKSDNRIDVTHSAFGGVSDSPAYVPSEDIVTIGMGPQATNANHAAWLDNVDPSADFVTPFIGEDGITLEQYKHLDQTGSIKLGENQEALGYSIDTSSGALLRNGTQIGSTQITEDNYIYNTDEYGRAVGENEGKKVYAAQPTVWDLDGNILGHIEVNNDGSISLGINPGYAQYIEGNEARKQDPNIDPELFNEKYILHGDEDPAIFSWDTLPNFQPAEAASQASEEQLANTAKPTIPQFSPQPTPGLPDFLMPTTTFPGISTRLPQESTQAQPENELPSFSMPGPLNFNQGEQNMALPPFLLPTLQNGGLPSNQPANLSNPGPHPQAAPSFPQTPFPQPQGGQLPPLQSLIEMLRPQGPQGPHGSLERQSPLRLLEELIKLQGSQGPSPAFPQPQGGQQSIAGQPKNLSSFLNILKSLAQSGQLRD